LKRAFANIRWREDPESFDRWARGQTGYPLVDAGMRQLNATGWMHNRVRMVTASFLVKHLLIDWRAGEAWYWDRLVDADPASNAANWQWVAGCGADASPWFRIFNPVLQGRKFDPDGVYVRHWVPELCHLPPPYLHAPWSAPAHVLEAAGLQLGVDYPRPVVDHSAARRRAQECMSA
jgi:deoxyribodipyrimidine photo-lyase